MCRRLFQVGYTDYVVKVNMSIFGFTLSRTARAHEQIRVLLAGKFQVREMVLVNICLFELSSRH